MYDILSEENISQSINPRKNFSNSNI